jgi:hypothetical protein
MLSASLSSIFLRNFRSILGVKIGPDNRGLQSNGESGEEILGA